MTKGRFRIAVIPGDGIGQEVVPEGLRVLNQVAANCACCMVTFLLESLQA